jgi:hypothetical protein
VIREDDIIGVISNIVDDGAADPPVHHYVIAEISLQAAPFSDGRAAYEKDRAVGGSIDLIVTLNGLHVIPIPVPGLCRQGLD